MKNDVFHGKNHSLVNFSDFPLKIQPVTLKTMVFKKKNRHSVGLKKGLYWAN